MIQLFQVTFKRYLCNETHSDFNEYICSTTDISFMMKSQYNNRVDADKSYLFKKGKEHLT